MIVVRLLLLMLLASGNMLRGDPVAIRGSSGKVVAFDGVKEVTPQSLIVRVAPGEPEKAIAWEYVDLAALEKQHPKIHDARVAAQRDGSTLVVRLGSYEGPLDNRLIVDAIPQVDFHDDAAHSPKAELMNLPAYLYRARPEQLPLPFRFHAPEVKMETGDARLPLVIWLHGSGAGGDDNLRGLYFPLLEKLIGKADEDPAYRAFLCCPQFQRAYNWWTQAPGTPDQVPGIAGAHVCELIDELCEQLPIDPERIYLIGMSQGAFAQSTWISTYENRFAASVRIAGANPSQFLHEGNLVPSWFFYSTADDIVMLADVAPRAVKEHQLLAPEKTRVTVYDDATHTQTLHRAVESEGLVEWMFEQRNPRKPVKVDRLWRYYFLGQKWEG